LDACGTEDAAKGRGREIKDGHLVYSADIMGPVIIISLHLLDDLDHIFIVQFVILAHSLRLMLHRRSPDQRTFELFQDGLVDAIAEILHRVMSMPQHNRFTTNS
jgi:hypothetical protein